MDPTEDIIFFCQECSLVRYLAIDVLLFRPFDSAGMCLVTRCLAMGIHVTIHIATCTYLSQNYNRCQDQPGGRPALMLLSIGLDRNSQSEKQRSLATSCQDTGSEVITLRRAPP
jgi:hypothetical protein